jgi:spermidine/putrescine transport system ATP-binding protein
MNDVVRLENVTKRFGVFEAVRGLSLAVAEGEFLTLLGASGCGKTTTLRLINGFEIADDGEIYIDGAIVNAISPYRRPVHTVFQSYALFPHLSVFDNVAYGLSIRRVDKRIIRKRVLEMLDRVGLSDRASSRPQQLSGGQMQRVALARAIINEPRVLLLDEPLGALDAKLRRTMQLELKRIQSGLGITFIYVTHDQEEALVMSDRIAVMNEGRLMQIGSPAEIFERPANRFVAEFIGTENFLTAKVGEATEGGRRVHFGPESRLIAAAASGFGEGRPVILAVRPQRIRVMAAPGGKDSGNVLPVRLRQVVYVGAVVRLVLELDGGTMVQAENLPENLPFDFRRLREGDRLWVHVPASALLVYGVDE